MSDTYAQLVQAAADVPTTSDRIVHVWIGTNSLEHYCWSVYRGAGGWANFISCGTTDGSPLQGRHRAAPGLEGK